MISFKHIQIEEHGSALITVLIIALIVSLFVGVILGGIYLQSSFIQRDINSTKAVYKAEQQIFKYLDSGVFPDSLGELTSVNYGGYQFLSSTSKVRKREVTIDVLVGTVPGPVFDYAVALQDTNSALNLTGSTRVVGDVATGSDQISFSNFKGFPFRGSFDGEAKKEDMTKAFPEFQFQSIESQIDRFESYFEEDLRRFSSDELADLSASKESDTLYFEESQIWQLSEDLEAPNKSVLIVDGNLSISGEGSLGKFASFIVRDTLTIGGDVTGKHSLLSAGNLVELTGEVSLSGQVISRGRIVISGQAYLEYPSVVYSSTQTYLGEQSEAIHLQDQSQVDGVVMFPIPINTATREQFRIKIDPGVTVRGAVYNAGQTELAGSIYGTALTNQFYFYESPTSYINWLKDAVIDRSKRPQDFVVPIGFSDSTRYTVLDWKVLE